MKKLIYQFWKGKRPDYSYASEELFQKYAMQINADYYLGNGKIKLRCLHKRYFAALMPLLTKDFDEYDIILYVDMDIVPVFNLKKDIFELTNGHIMMCEEVCQPQLRTNMKGKINSQNDVKWANTVEDLCGKRPFLEKTGKPRVFNSGVVIYTRNGINFLRKKLPSILRYQISMKLRGLPKFYSFDQNYLNAFLNLDGVQFSKLPEIWNSQVIRYEDNSDQIHLLDRRSEKTCFIHVQPGPLKKKLSKHDMLMISQGCYSIAENINGPSPSKFS